MAKLQIINHKQRHLKNFGTGYPEGVKLVTNGLSSGANPAFLWSLQGL
jgi:Flp pilus assembly protein TadB